jgi:hypothetical protein
LYTQRDRERKRGERANTEEGEREERERASVVRGIGEWDFVGDRLYPAVSSGPCGSATE